MGQLVAAPDETALTFQRLNARTLDAAVALCDACVGINLYPRAQLAAAMDDAAQHFYILLTPEREAVGYIYFFLSDLDAMSALSKLPKAQLAGIADAENPVIGNLQSIGVAAPHRHHRLSQALMRFYLEQLQCLGADAAFGVFWKANGVAPMEKTLKNFDFLYLADARGVWYDKQDLICPYCEGRCQCDAAVYYKPLKRRA